MLCHGPARFAALKNFFVVLLCRLSTTFNWTPGRVSSNTIQLTSRFWNNFSSKWFEAFQKQSKLWLGRAPPNTAQFFSRCWRTFFVQMFCSHFKTFKFMAGPRSPTSPVTARLFSRRWITFSFWCYANCLQRSIQRLVVLPQTRSSSFHGVKTFFRLNGWKLFKNNHSYGRTVLCQTRPSSFYGVDQPFGLNVMQPFKNFQVYGWAALPNIPCHVPVIFAALKSFFVLMLCRLSTTFKSTTGRAPPNTVQIISRCRKPFLVWMVWSFSRTLDFVAGPCSSKHGAVPFTVLKNYFVWMLCSHSKPFKLMAGPRSPTPLVTAQLISRRWRVFSFYGDCQQRSNKRLVVLPQTRSSSLHDVEALSRLIGMKLFKNTRFYSWAVLLQKRINPFIFLKNFFVGMLCYILKLSSLWLGLVPQHPLSQPSFFRGA